MKTHMPVTLPSITSLYLRGISRGKHGGVAFPNPRDHAGSTPSGKRAALAFAPDTLIQDTAASCNPVWGRSTRDQIINAPRTPELQMPVERQNGARWSNALGCGLVAIAVLFGTSFAQAEGCGDIAGLTSRLEADLPRWMKTYDVPGVSLLVMSGGEIEFVRAYGLADLRTWRALTVDDVFRVESISKPVTAWGVMRLAQLGRLDIDAPVRSHVQDLPLADSITTRMVLDHTAGLPLGDFTARFDPDGLMPTLHESLLHDLSRPATPAGRYAYSDTGYNLLELLVENIAGEAFADYMQREVLEPLGMMQSTFRWETDLRVRMPTAHDLRGGAIAPYVYPGHGSGGLFATIGDIGKFMQASVGSNPGAQDVLGPEGIALMHQLSVSGLGLFDLVADGYGLGHFVESTTGDRNVVWHGGQGAGWMTDFHVIPATGDGIAILSNSQRSWPVFARILADWSAACSIPTVGMARIRIAELSVWAITFGAGICAIWGLFLGVRGIRSGQRRFRPLSASNRGHRSVQAFLATAILGGLIWANAQDYLFIWSVAPTAIPWLTKSLLALALALAVLALAVEEKPSR